MGVVLAAYDPELDRKVAVKLLKGSGGEAARVRLQREAQALARLQHPNVVAVHDVGVHEGHVFVAMEFVAGTTLSDWLEVSRPWTAIAAMLNQAGRGLEAAHRAGLVHRDFKPDNVMVDSSGRARVMDFGLARSDESGAPDTDGAPLGSDGGDATLTRTGALMGTPAYMSPEQFQGLPADARSDQFGFCVTAWEAMLGERPFTGSTLHELALSVTQGEIRPVPRTVPVPTRVVSVLRRGLSLAPDDRWPSMSALLEALSPAPSRRGWWLAGVGAIGLAAGSIAFRPNPPAPCRDMAAHLNGVWDDARRAEVGRALRSTGLSFSDSTAVAVSQTLDAYAATWVGERTSSCEATRVSGEQSEPLLDRSMACFDARLGELDATARVLARADATIVEHALATAQALSPVTPCRDPAVLNADPLEPDPAIVSEVDAIRDVLSEADVERRAGHPAAALERIAGLEGRAGGTGHVPLIVDEAIVRAALLRRAQEFERSGEVADRALILSLEHGLERRGARAARELTSTVGYELARIDVGERTASIGAALARATGDRDVLASVLFARASVLSEAKRSEEAESVLREVLSIRREQEPRSLATASTLSSLGNALVDLGRYDEARDALTEAAEIRTEQLSSDHPGVAGAHHDLGMVDYKQGRLEDARDHWERAVAIRAAALGENHRDVASLLNNLGTIEQRLGDSVAAREHFERALAVKIELLGPDHTDVGNQNNNLGVVARGLGDYEQAETRFLKALSIWEKSSGPTHTRLGPALDNPGSLALQRDRLDEARRWFERAVKIREEGLGPEHPELSTSLLGLGNTLRAQGDAKGALALLQRSVDIREKAGIGAFFEGQALEALAKAAWEAGGRQRAVAAGEQARDRYRSAGERRAAAAQRMEAWLEARAAP
jgi:tetratricopeptide (TPR) repeat protein